MTRDWRTLIDRWRAAGLIDDQTAARIAEFETGNAQPTRLEWPVVLALTLGGIALGAGILLLIATNWERLSQNARFALVVLLVAVFHIAGLASPNDSRAFRSAFHAIGTIALGPAIAMTDGIFHLPENWQLGTFLWLAGAFFAWLLLRDEAQFGAVAVLVPFWLGSEMIDFRPAAWEQVYAAGTLVALAYLGATPRSLHWIGGIALLPFALLAALPLGPDPSLWTLAGALALIISCAAFVRSKLALVTAAFGFWAVLLSYLVHAHSFFVELWLALGFMGLICWGWQEAGKDRVNLGVAGFALAILWFYISSVADKLNKSIWLISLGALLIAGGWLLELARRRLVARL